MMLLELSELYQVELNMKELITICTRKLFVLLPSMGNVKEEDSERCIDALKNIYNIKLLFYIIFINYIKYNIRLLSIINKDIFLYMFTLNFYNIFSIFER